MTVSYTQVTVTGYNSSPPSDDGATDASNRVTWAGIKTKLTDPLKTAIDSVDDNVAAAIALAEADINTEETARAAADTANLATLRGELNGPSTTAMLFKQTSAPTGWTKQTDQNDKALRIVSGTPSTGGSTAFSSVFTSRTIAQANLPNVNLSAASLTATPTDSRTYQFSQRATNQEQSCGSGGLSAADDSNSTVTITMSSPASGSLTVAIGGNVPLGGSGTAMDFAVQYVDVIYATKN